jgi:hypothetical protein
LAKETATLAAVLMDHVAPMLDRPVMEMHSGRSHIAERRKSSANSICVAACGPPRVDIRLGKSRQFALLQTDGTCFVSQSSKWPIRVDSARWAFPKVDALPPEENMGKT